MGASLLALAKSIYLGINMFFSSWSQQVNFALVVYCYPLGIMLIFCQLSGSKRNLICERNKKGVFTFVSVVLPVDIFWLQITTPPPFSRHKSMQRSVN